MSIILSCKWIRHETWCRLWRRRTKQLVTFIMQKSVGGRLMAQVVDVTNCFDSTCVKTVVLRLQGCAWIDERRLGINSKSMKANRGVYVQYTIYLKGSKVGERYQYHVGVPRLREETWSLSIRFLSAFPLHELLSKESRNYNCHYPSQI